MIRTTPRRRAFCDGYRAAYMGHGPVTGYTGELIERWQAGYAAGEKARTGGRRRAGTAKKAVRA